MSKDGILYKKVFSRVEKVGYLSKKAIVFAWYRHHFLIPPRVMYKYAKSFYTSLRRGNTTSNLYTNQLSYINWFEKNMAPLKEHKTFKYNPLFSFIVPNYNPEDKFLRECIESMLNQSYKNFEIVICDDASTKPETLQTLKEYENNDKIKVVYRKENGMISKASNDAIAQAKGEFIVLVDNDDVVHPDSLYYIVEALNKNPKLDFIYSDEDKLDFSGKVVEPHFKPDYSPDTMMCLNYICHLSCIRKSLVDKVGGFRSEYDGAQDYDLFLRVLEQTDRVYHIEKVLYHWRQSSTSTAAGMDNKDYAFLNGQNAVKDSLSRRGLKGEVSSNPRVTANLVKYAHNNPLVSVIIPMHDQVDMTKRCIDSLYEVNKYKNFEIVIADNNSQEEDTAKYLDELQKQYDNVKVLHIKEEFNYSRINNIAARAAKGEYLLLLNNDTEVTQPDFLDWMVGQGSLDYAGCVGIKLLYPNKLVQHAGTVLGFGGVAGHIFVACSYQDNGLFGRLVMPYNYSAVTAACMLIKKSKFEEIGGFDERLKVALNDVDLCLKAMKAGYYNVCLSNVEMLHYESKSRGYEASQEKHDRFMKEQAYMKEKWSKMLDRDKFFSKNNF